MKRIKISVQMDAHPVFWPTELPIQKLLVVYLPAITVVVDSVDLHMIAHLDTW